MTHYQRQLSLTDLIVAVSCRCLGVLARGASECQQQNSREEAKRYAATSHCAGLPVDRLLGPLLSCARTEHRTPMLAEWRRARPFCYRLPIREKSDKNESLCFSCGLIGFLSKQGECTGKLFDIWTRVGQIRHTAIAGVCRKSEDCDMCSDEH